MPDKIVLVFRDPSRQGTSVEEIYSGLLNELKKRIDIEAYYYDDSRSVLSNCRSIRDRNPGIVHITSDVYYIVPFLGRAKTVITIHDIGRFKTMKGIRRWIYKLIWLKMPTSLADGVITVSNYTRENVLKYLGAKLADKVNVIYNPVPTGFRYWPKTFNVDCPEILQVGSAIHKNLDRVIKALKGIHCRLVIIGRITPQQKTLLEENEIDFRQFSSISYEDVQKQYGSCDMVTFVSIHEGFGMPVVEANATGRPILCSSICSLPEIGGDAALYVEDPTSVEEIRDKIKYIIAHSSVQKELIDNGLKNVARFDFGRIINQYERYYKKIKG